MNRAHMSWPRRQNVSKTASGALPHTAFEDAIAIMAGSIFIALGFCLLKNAGLLTSGISGITFLVHYGTGWDAGLVFFMLNVPFYGLALMQLGWAFTVKTFAAVCLISLLVDQSSSLLTLGAVTTMYGAVAGGTLVGFGLLALFRHGASIGGTSTLAMYCQRKFGWTAGYVLVTIDVLIFVAATLMLDGGKVLWSLLGATALNAMVLLNHRPGRYMTL